MRQSLVNKLKFQALRHTSQGFSGKGLALLPKPEVRVSKPAKFAGSKLFHARLSLLGVVAWNQGDSQGLKELNCI